MTFESRHDERRRVLERLQFAAKILAVFYLSLHFAVTVLAFKLGGAWQALVTLVALGFGDLYWAAAWAHEEGRGSITLIAAVSAVTCFASWLLRPAFDRWARSFTADMVADTVQEIDKITMDRLDQQHKHDASNDES